MPGIKEGKRKEMRGEFMIPLWKTLRAPMVLVWRRACILLEGSQNRVQGDGGRELEGWEPRGWQVWVVVKISWDRVGEALLRTRNNTWQAAGAA